MLNGRINYSAVPNQDTTSGMDPHLRGDDNKVPKLEDKATGRLYLLVLVGTIDQSLAG